MSVGETAEALEERGPHLGVAFAIVTMALLLGSVDSSIVSTALPAIHSSLHATINWTGWTITIYSLGNVVVLPLAGRLSDQYGRRKVFAVGVFLFTAASLACGFANDIGVLIALRALQSIGSATLQPSAAGIIADHFGRNRDRALGMFATINSSGQMAGPIFGGLLVNYLSWRWIFFVNVPVGLLLLLLIRRFIPTSSTRPHAKSDVQGMCLLAALILTANFAITGLGNHHASLFDPGFLVPAIAAIGLGARFATHLRQTPTPFIPRRLLWGKGFAAINAENLMFAFASMGIATLMPLYAEQRFHMSALNAGTMITARGLGSVVIGAFTALALRRVGYRKPMAVGYALVAIGTLQAAFGPRLGFSAYAWLAVANGICGLGVGVTNPASRLAGMQLAPDDIAAITGLRQMFNYSGSIFSVAIMTAILNRSGDPGLTTAHIQWVAAATLVLVMIPLTRKVPEHKGTW